jgi:SDR family mycofactocin-dependent oxidoreductase
VGSLEDKVAFITGVARGQGRSHAIRLAEEGADIVGVDICAPIEMSPYPMASETDLEETARLVEKTGRQALLEVGDVRDRARLQAVFDAGVERFGYIDVVCANAGVSLSGATDDMAAWHVTIDVLLTGTYHTVQVALPHLMKRQQGNIIVVSSVAGIRGMSDGRGGTDAYSAAKAGILGLVKAWAAYLGPQNIRVNAVAPGGVATPMLLDNPNLPGIMESNPHLQNSMANALPVDMIQPEDISAAVAFLASDSARYITGCTIAVDAGLLAR